MRAFGWQRAENRGDKVPPAQVDPVLKARGFNSLKLQCFQVAGVKYQPAPLVQLPTHHGEALFLERLDLLEIRARARALSRRLCIVMRRDVAYHAPQEECHECAEHAIRGASVMEHPRTKYRRLAPRSRMKGSVPLERVLEENKQIQNSPTRHR